MPAYGCELSLTNLTHCPVGIKKNSRPLLTVLISEHGGASPEINLAAEKEGVRRDKCLFPSNTKKGGRLTPPQKDLRSTEAPLLQTLIPGALMEKGGSPPCGWVKRSAAGRLRI